MVVLVEGGTEGVLGREGGGVGFYVVGGWVFVGVMWWIRREERSGKRESVVERVMYHLCTCSFWDLGSVVRACLDGWARLETAERAMGMAWLGGGRYRGHFSSITECKDAGARRGFRGYLCLRRGLYGGRCTCGEL